MSVRYQQALRRYSLRFGVILAGFLGVLSLLEAEGLPRQWSGYFFLFGATLAYAGIGLSHRTSSLEQFYVAGHRIPPLYNGMASAADWISAASFITIVGALYVQGFSGFAWLLGWSGGFCLLAILIAPFLRKLPAYTLADFLAQRYAPDQAEKRDALRLAVAAATIVISFIYVIAQIYAVGLITSRLIGVDFSSGIFLGLASMLVCSFLGGMRSLSWTQIVQYLILLLAFALPTLYLGLRHHSLPPLAYGAAAQELRQVERVQAQDAAEQAVRQRHLQAAQALQAQIAALPESWRQGREQRRAALASLRTRNASLDHIRKLEQELARYPASPQDAARLWKKEAAQLQERAQAPPSLLTPQQNGQAQTRNFIALAFCLMAGTAALPHLLMRSMSTYHSHAARESIFWALFFILLLYLCIPALALLLKLEVWQQLHGVSYQQLPAWIDHWRNLEQWPALLSLEDWNGDGLVQLSELNLDPDILVLAAADIAHMPHLFAGLLAAGALAAALSTADGLLLTIGNTLTHDIYHKTLAPEASAQRRVVLSKLVLLALAFLAAYVASQKPADIVSLVSAAFSLAASCLLPVLAAAVFFPRVGRRAVLGGMAAGAGVCIWYLLRCHPALGGHAGNAIWQLQAHAAGVFGLPAALLCMFILSRWEQPSQMALLHWRRLHERQ
ncbi:VC_2705 family sodium/solute symporter [Massilia sp. W12]|uniref:VC_2705 family sodium/solute symporter n=1 Tax=Massilia sp. W12 TaxID=3126507 RepID=UPI0030D32B86